MSYYRYPTVKEIEIDIRKKRVKKVKQKALKWKSRRTFRYFKKHESETEYNRNIDKMVRNE